MFTKVNFVQPFAEIIVEFMEDSAKDRIAPETNELALHCW